MVPQLHSQYSVNALSLWSKFASRAMENAKKSKTSQWHWDGTKQLDLLVSHSRWASFMQVNYVTNRINAKLAYFDTDYVNKLSIVP